MKPTLETTRHLDCRLTYAEVDRIAMALSTKIPELEALKEEKKDVAKDFGDRIKQREVEISNLARKVRHRTETRPVICRLVPRRNEELVDIIRTDTGEIIDTREMTAHERSGDCAESCAGPTTTWDITRGAEHEQDEQESTSELPPPGRNPATADGTGAQG